MKWKILAATGVVAVALGAYLFAGNSDNTESNETDTASVKQMIHDFSARNLKAQSASITWNQLSVTDEDSKSVTYDLPEDEFFLSIAPYVEKTHPCEIHSLTGCQGEMVGKTFNVTITDLEGNSILEKTTMESQPNGFIDLWLPRDNTYRVTIEHEGKTAEAELSTFENDNTCIATMQLG